MLAAPAKRSAASSIAARRSNARRTPPGLRNGRMPSITSRRPSAAARSGHAMFMVWARSATRLLQVLEEFALRRDDEHVARLADRVAVRLEAAVQRVELGIALVGARGDGGSLRVALAADDLRVAVAAREELGALPLGLGADALRLLVALGAPLRGLARETRPHAVVDRLRHLVGQVDALHAHVDERQAELIDGLPRDLQDVADELCPLRRDHSLDRALGDDALEAVLHDLREAPGRRLLVAVGREVVARDVRDAPLH